MPMVIRCTLFDVELNYPVVIPYLSNVQELLYGLSPGLTYPVICTYHVKVLIRNPAYCFKSNNKQNHK